jgi:hypothetical protein
VKAAEVPRKSVAQVASPVPVQSSDVITSTTTSINKKRAKKKQAVKMEALNPERPWEGLDASDKTIASQQPLRLNAYQYEQLKWLAESEDRSLAQILRRIVGPALEEAVRAER